MSEENVEVAVKQFEGATARDFAGVMDTWADDVTLSLHWEANPLSGTVTSKAAVGGWHRDWMRQFGLDYRFDIEEMHDTGDSVFVLATHHGRGRQSGVTVEQRVAHVYTLREGKVSRIEIWVDHDAREAALEAVGLRE
jgi:uncharacterized protein